MPAVDYYQQRIHLALRYLDTHLQEELKVADLARAAHFSPYHFQRIYKALQGETPYDTLLRLRLERAIFLLKHRPQLRIAEVGVSCGFASAENFSRQFRERYGHAPSTFRKRKDLHNSRIYQERQAEDFYHCYEEGRQRDAPTFQVTIESLPEMTIAFVRGIFGTDGSILVQRYQELIAWAEAAALPYQGALRRFGRSIDNPEVTPANKYRYDFALRLDQQATVNGLVELGSIPAGQYATLHCQGDITTVAQAWDYLYQDWLPKSSFLPVHQPALEEFIQGPEEIGWTTFNIKCRIPVQTIQAV